MSKQLQALPNDICFFIMYCNKGYCSTYEGFKHAPFFVCMMSNCHFGCYIVDANS